MKQSVKIDLNNKSYGGRLYENEIVRLLSDDFEFKREFMLKYKIKILNTFHILWLIIRYKYFFKGVLLLTNQTTFFAGKQSRNIVVIHHIENFQSGSFVNRFQAYCDNYFFRHTDRFKTVVTVACIWRDKLIKAHVRDVRVIYNSFEASNYTFSKEEIDAFKRKYNLIEKPVVYLGNCQRKKGVLESYNSLKDEDYHLVTSGLRLVDVPAINLNLQFDEYKLLLASSDVVLTMSKFAEGWNRTAHEASLCGKPVIGSGMGGMHELLEMANQTETTDYTRLPQLIKERLNKSYSVPEDLLRLNYEYFKTEWLKVLE